MSKIARSFLFVPGDRSDRFAKAAASGAHTMIIDLEDAVGLNAKADARAATEEWLASGNLCCVRINSADTEWFVDDITMVSQYDIPVMLPKADLESLQKTSKAIPNQTLIALVETVRGYMELRPMVAITNLSRFAFGSIDFGVESGIDDTADTMTVVRTNFVLESCYGGLLPPVDGVSVNIKDEALAHQDAKRSKQLGFGGKLCIHPKQVAAVNSAFTPTPEQADWAQRVLQAFTESQGAAVAVDGKMIDKPVVEQARQIVADLTN